jgi:hypothetical protein
MSTAEAGQPLTDTKLDELCINTIRTLSERTSRRLEGIRKCSLNGAKVKSLYQIMTNYYTCREIHVHLKTLKACLHRST